MTNTVTNQKSQTSYKAQKIISNVIIYAFLIFLLLLSIVPFYLVVVNATHSSFDMVTKPVSYTHLTLPTMEAV